MCGDVDNREKPSLLSGNSIRNSFARCITVHGSHGVQVCIGADPVFSMQTFFRADPDTTCTILRIFFDKF